MEKLLFLDTNHENLLPLTYTRPIADLRIGILTIAEKWTYRLNMEAGFITEPYLQAKFAGNFGSDNLIINGGCLPNTELVEAIKNLKIGEAIIKNDKFIAARTNKTQLNAIDLSDFQQITFSSEYKEVEYPWHIFSWNGDEIRADFEILTTGRKSQIPDPTNRIAGKENVFIEEGATVKFATINADRGPVYIGKDAEIMENCVIRGPFAMLPGSVLKMGAKVYGPTTLGPVCKVGGEINNSVFQANSNKAHDGFLGNSVIGEWCNLGADTNNSNLKNNYAEVRIWNYNTESFKKTGLQFCGLIMGDHSKCGINTMFNTGTVVGVSANIFGSGFPRNFIPSYSWGGAQGFTEYKLNKSLEVAKLVFERRNKDLDQIEIDILTHIYEQTAKYRKF
ncbi:MAG: glucose-1-phosphate thymidylyltransferase [Salinivirgaceae bacterium]|nr:MAG: glucose-1-phosphate thymidylyltransferase [Salinivirgaceae bacterium]